MSHYESSPGGAAGGAALPSAAKPMLYLVCGKAGSGKSTLARNLADKHESILIDEDDWLARLYRDQIHDLADYVRCTGMLRDVLGDHLVVLLKRGVSVVLDFPANTLAFRQWAKGIFDKAGVAHELHYLEVPDATCKARLRERNASGCHPFTVSEEAFDAITRYFVPPAPEEGFNTFLHRE
ncbi:AAA family ATPase [Geomesophilobacter sediminis]|uniref:ATP-binding protein n=1 Tax=Geomesophilobacter sediminis TaxID=2798584 RepID=A0A8J7J4Z6_9BACT|nr:ATP-binding protein [Geomesophilobacter sediminis]MBJ6723341.1 ATP-binding protein [Geomesophilobacter sediminis]